MPCACLIGRSLILGLQSPVWVQPPGWCGSPGLDNQFGSCPNWFGTDLCQFQFPEMGIQKESPKHRTDENISVRSMDPIAKRFMWEVISHLSTRQGKTAVILTTHSMNEAQALCTRIGVMVAGRLRCIGSPQHLKTRFGNHLELEVKPTEVSTTDLDQLCRRIQDALFYFPCHPRSILSDLEVCIGGSDSITSDNVTEISLSQEMIIAIGHFLGNEERIRTLISCTPITDGVFGEQLSEQLIRDGGIPLRIFSEWWLAKEKFSMIDSFIHSSFPGAMFQGCNGLSVKYQLPYSKDSSLADIFGHLDRNSVFGQLNSPGVN
ncbi:ABC transporter family protein [Cinnamomum micranthum f. kanehirae]|uniref:ABC transporter family protein n=1 Tax=Cinnamomum micranthum f. kanehirae TaxID=337451 RepID=A0A3S3NPX7_9MAGN|nr:ABC transporter family protein [Cinnamomum micranthum f. kanehirae]